MSENQESLTPGHTAKGNRRKGRELALQALYQIAITGDASADAVDLFLQHFEGGPQPKEFARRLVSGVVSQTAELDRIIAECTENWKLPRLAKVDLESGVNEREAPACNNYPEEWPKVFIFHGARGDPYVGQVMRWDKRCLNQDRSGGW